jgi:hypothetical protein
MIQNKQAELAFWIISVALSIVFNLPREISLQDAIKYYQFMLFNLNITVGQFH